MLLRLVLALSLTLLCFGCIADAVLRSPTASRRRNAAAHDRRGRRGFVSSTAKNVVARNAVDKMPGAPNRKLTMGSCSNVSYGELELQHNNLAELPLNELMIQLEKPPFVHSPNPYGPTIADISLYVYEIADVDPGENTFFMEAFLDLIWCDARLRFDAAAENVTTKYFLEEDAEKELQYIWFPDVFFVNEILPRHIENEEIIIDSDGTIEYREKFGVKLMTNYNMKRFPFDSQILIAELESFAWSSAILQFHIKEELVGFSEEFDVPEFVIAGLEEHLEERMELRDRHPFSELVVEIYVTRDPTYYVTKVIIPLTLIVCISWAVFWMDQGSLADRMSISFTGVLTSVAYQFIVSESLPRHIYNTFLDNFVLFSFCLMVLTIVENIAVNVMYTRDKVNQSKKVDKACRFIFPIAFAIGVGIIAAVHL